MKVRIKKKENYLFKGVMRDEYPYYYSVQIKYWFFPIWIDIYIDFLEEEVLKYAIDKIKGKKKNSNARNTVIYNDNDIREKAFKRKPWPRPTGI